jgi:hypothetical protein
MIFFLKFSAHYIKRFPRFLITLNLLITLLAPTFAFGQYLCKEGDCENGIGEKIVINSSAYMKGRFEQGVLKEGDVLFPNGDLFQGKFENNKLAEGKKTFKDGKRLEGKFFENVLIKGKITYKDGTSNFIELNRHR